MYEELVKRLREVEEMLKVVQFKEAANLIEQAADAIEEQQAQIDGWIKQERTALLQSIPKWIPVTERLPKEYESVLCWYEYSRWSKKQIPLEYGIGYIINGQWGGEVSNGKYCKVLAWMPLPEPPKED